MGSNEIYTIGREFGSLGKQVGQELAKRLGIKFYDKELLQKAAKESGLCEEIFESHDEKPTNSFLYSLVMDTYTGGSYSTAPFLDMPLNHKVFLAQFDAIKKIAANESCVIVGRCADYALADEPHCLNIFIRSNMDDRIKKKDKERSSYYNYYTSKKWGDARSYDLCLNTSQISVEDSIELILKYRECMRNHNK